MVRHSLSAELRLILVTCPVMLGLAFLACGRARLTPQRVRVLLVDNRDRVWVRYIVCSHVGRYCGWRITSDDRGSFSTETVLVILLYRLLYKSSGIGVAAWWARLSQRRTVVAVVGVVRRLVVHVCTNVMILVGRSRLPVFSRGDSDLAALARVAIASHSAVAS